jgi:hypothetical protein
VVFSIRTLEKAHAASSFNPPGFFGMGTMVPFIAINDERYSTYLKVSE